MASVSEPLRWLCSLGAVWICLIAMWQHHSDEGPFLNAFSYRYSLLLMLGTATAVSWLVVFIRRKRLAPFLRLLIPVSQWLFVLPGVAIVLTLLLPIAQPFRDFVLINVLAAAALLSGVQMPERTRLRRGLQIALMGILVLLMLGLLLTHLNDLRFSPDEAHWADYASTAIRAGGLYARTWLQEPVVILPGLGWSVAVYGWLLENVAFDIRIGRLWTFGWHLLAVLGVGLVTWRLYGKKAAWVSAGFVLVSITLMPVWDYRPHYQLTAASMFIAFAAVHARRVSRWAALWHLLCGLLATLSLQLHAGGIFFVVGFGLFYLLDFIIGCVRRRRVVGWQWLALFGLGTLVGGVFYYFANIAPVGGLTAFWEALTASRGARNPWVMPVWYWPSLVEAVIIYFSFGYLLWRRKAEDRLFLGLVLCVALAKSILDTQGYISPVVGFFAVPIGVLMVDGLSLLRERPVWIWLSLCLIGGLAVMRMGDSVAWSEVWRTLREGRFAPTVYEQLRPLTAPLVYDDDVVVSNHLYLFTQPELSHLVSVAGELTAMRRWGYSDPLAVWERVQPTVIIDIEREMEMPQGLLSYMAQEQFDICQQFLVAERTITLYRENCES